MSSRATRTIAHEQLARRLATVVGIPVVPYDESGAIDHALTAALTTRLLDHGIEVLTANGNTGEFYALTPAERRDVLSTVCSARRDQTVIVAGVGLDPATAADDARFARHAGADAIMIHQPVLPYLSPAGWIEYNASVAAAVPELGVVPYLSTTAIGGAEIAELTRRCPNVVALKYSVPDPVVFATTREEAGEGLLWIAGLAESYAPAYWAAGARGFTSGLVNLAPAVSLALLAALRSGDAATARQLWHRIRHFEQLRARNRSADNVSVVKEAMHQVGLCRREVRPPSHVLAPSTAREVTDAVDELAEEIPALTEVPA